MLVWPGKKNLPKPVQDRLGTLQQGEIPGLVLDHIRNITRATKGLLDEWDVLNEPFTNFDLMTTFGDEIIGLKQKLKPPLADLIPDVEIFHKAVRYALDYDELFIDKNRDDVRPATCS